MVKVLIVNGPRSGETVNVNGFPKTLTLLTNENDYGMVEYNLITFSKDNFNRILGVWGMPETQWYFCEVCCEEYELIEDYEGECPVCGKDELEPV